MARGGGQHYRNSKPWDKYCGDFVAAKARAATYAIVGDISSQTPHTQILQPKEVRESRHNGPYAYTVPFVEIQDLGLHTANFIRADAGLDDQFQRYCNMGFNDSV